MLRADIAERRHRNIDHILRVALMRPQPARGKEARDDAVEYLQRRFGVEVELHRRRHDAEQLAQVEDVPAVLPEDADIGTPGRIKLARDQLDQCRFARTVGAKDRGALARRDGQRGQGGIVDHAGALSMTARAREVERWAGRPL
jgi:hypothetical protein